MGLLVVGMHRSGTSALGRVLDAMGLPTAKATDLIGADEHNTLGHWEVRSLTDFNDEILGTVGSHWAAPRSVDAEQLRLLADGALGDRARELLAEHLGGERWFWKDPRLSLLLPFWRQVMSADEPTVLFAGRHPAEVALSLQRRNDMPLEFGAALWERYTRQAIQGAAGLSGHVVTYDRLLGEPHDTVDRLGEFLTAGGLVGDVDTDAGAAAVASDQRHHREHGPLAPAVDELWAAVAASADQALPDATSLGPESPGIELAFLVRAEMAAEARRDARRLSSELEDARTQAQASVDRLTGELRDEQRKARAHLDRLAAEQAHINEQAQAEIDRVARERAEELAEERADAVAAHAAVERRRALVETERRDLAVALADARAEAAHARGLELQLADARRQLDAEISSTAHQAAALYRRGSRRAIPEGTARAATYRRLVGGVRRATGAAIRRAETRRVPAPPPLVVPRSSEPEVSIVIPVHGEWETTRRCLLSIAAHTGNVAYEVIVVDDASPDDSAVHLGDAEGIEVVTNDVNLGYLRSTNAGAERARGDYVVLLNNDTEVTDGWLRALLDTFVRHPHVGAVGAKLVYPTGTLQEAGGIVWSDGTGWNYGRHGNPDSYEVGFVREVDYCSAACLAVPRELWKRLGGFDEMYAPAYYEDTDLAFRVREMGYRVMFQPAARVVHYEGVSHGTDEAVGLKRYQGRNRARFVDRWASELQLQHLPDAEQVRRAGDRAKGASILVVDHQVPAPDRDAGSLRMSLILEMLVDLGYRVRFYPVNHDRNSPYEEPLQQLGVEVVYGDVDPRGYLSSIGHDVDIAILSRPLVAIGWLPLLADAIPRCQIMYDMVDYHALREQRRGDLDDEEAARRQARVYSEIEEMLVRQSDVTIAVSDTEGRAVQAQIPDAEIAVIPTVHSRERSTTPFDQRAGLLFVGSWAHPPNRDAIQWLLEDILPLLRKRLPGVVVHIVGSDVPAEVAAGADDVVVHGWVEHIEPLFDEIRLSIAPLRYGAGLKGKVGDSLARGVPVVTTSIGAEGFDFADGFTLDVADDAAGFADAVTALYVDPDAWERAAQAGRAAVDARFGPEVVAGQLQRAIEALLERTGGSADVSTAGPGSPSPAQ